VFSLVDGAFEEAWLTGARRAWRRRGAPVRGAGLRRRAAVCPRL